MDFWTTVNNSSFILPEIPAYHPIADRYDYRDVEPHINTIIGLKNTKDLYFEATKDEIIKLLMDKLGRAKI